MACSRREIAATIALVALVALSSPAYAANEATSQSATTTTTTQAAVSPESQPATSGTATAETSSVTAETSSAATTAAATTAEGAVTAEKPLSAQVATTATAQSSATVADGVYTIGMSPSGATAGTSQLVLDSFAGGTAAGNPLQLWEANATPAQRYRVVNATGGFYLVCVGSGRVVVANSSGGLELGPKLAEATAKHLWSAVTSGTSTRLVWLATATSAPTSSYLALSSTGASSGAKPSLGSADKALDVSFVSTKTLDDGYYTVATKIPNAQGKKVLDVSAGSWDAGGNVQSWTGNDTGAQKWTVTYDPSTGYYTITNLQSTLALDVAGGSGANGANAWQWSRNGTAAQSWSIVEHGDGYEILSSVSGLALDVSGASAADGANVQVWDANNTSAQRWTFTMTTILSDGTYTLDSAVTSGRSLDVASGSSSDHSKLWLWESNGTAAQKFIITTQSDGTRRLECLNSGKVLGFAGTDQDSVLEISTDTGSAYQRWNLVPSTSVAAGFELINAGSGMPIDLSGASSGLGARVRSWTANHTAAQCWRPVAANLITDGSYLVTDADGLAMDVSGNSRANGTNVQTWTSNDTRAQRFLFRSVGGDTYRILTYSSNDSSNLKSLDVDVASGNVQQWGYTGTTNQLWVASTDHKGGFILTSKATGKVITLEGAAAGKNVSSQASSENLATDQHLKLIPASVPPAPLTQSQIDVLNACHWTPSPGGGLCAMWISQVFNSLGYPYLQGDACDMFWAYCTSSNRDDLQPGMIIAVPSHGAVGTPGWYWGHIGIYQGDGIVMDNFGYIRTITLDYWIAKNGDIYTPQWGWAGGWNLAA